MLLLFILYFIFVFVVRFWLGYILCILFFLFLSSCCHMCTSMTEIINCCIQNRWRFYCNGECKKSLKKLALRCFFDETYIREKCCRQHTITNTHIRTYRKAGGERERQLNNDAFQRIARFFIQFVMICLFLYAIYLYTYNTVDSCFIRFSGAVLSLFPILCRNACVCVFVCSAGIFHQPQFNSISLRIYPFPFPSSIKSVLYTSSFHFVYCHLFCAPFLCCLSPSLPLFLNAFIVKLKRFGNVTTKNYSGTLRCDIECGSTMYSDDMPPTQ